MLTEQQRIKLQWTSFHFLILELLKTKPVNETLIKKDRQAIDLVNLDLG